ncbi:PspC domain-containing protein [Corynebacterium heidelbergense]|uniref:PspC domain-containing protein n=1 Tax=Corynebacterium heidelbergense TaxID=2055947 RepID=UPI0026D59F2E
MPIGNEGKDKSANAGNSTGVGGAASTTLDAAKNSWSNVRRAYHGMSKKKDGGPAAGARTDCWNVGPKRLTRSTTNRMIGGVCGGIAEYFGIPAVVVRVLVVASILIPGPQVLLYLGAWYLMPKR